MSKCQFVCYSIDFYLCPWRFILYYHVAIVTNMMYNIVLDKFFFIAIRYFSTRTMSIQRVFYPDGNTTAAGSFSFWFRIPYTRGKEGVNLVKINVSCFIQFNMKFHPCFSMHLTIYRNNEEVTAFNCFICPLYNHRANKVLWYILVISYSKMSSAHVYLSYTTRVISHLVFSYLCTDHTLSESFW